MKHTKLKKILSIVPISIIFIATCFSNEVSMTGYGGPFWNTGVIGSLDIPGKNGYNFEGGEDIIILVKEILARAVEYLPMIVLIVLLLACVKIIFDGDGKEGLKRIKYILIGVGLMILTVYLVNILSTIFFGHPVLNIHINKWY